MIACTWGPCVCLCFHAAVCTISAAGFLAIKINTHNHQSRQSACLRVCVCQALPLWALKCPPFQVAVRKLAGFASLAGVSASLKCGPLRWYEAALFLVCLAVLCLQGSAAELVPVVSVP